MPTTLSRSRRFVVTVTLAVALAGPTAACGSDDGDAGTTTTTLATDADDPTETEDTATGDAEGQGEGGGETPPPDVGGADRQAYVDALAGSAVPDDDVATPEQSECLAEGWVDTIGVDELQAAGLSPEQFAEGDDEPLRSLDLDEATAGAMYDQFASCDVDLHELFIASFAGQGDLTPDQQACVEDILTEDALRAGFIADIVGDDTVEDPFDGLMTCFT